MSAQAPLNERESVSVAQWTGIYQMAIPLRIFCQTVNALFFLGEQKPSPVEVTTPWHALSPILSYSHPKQSHPRKPSLRRILYFLVLKYRDQGEPAMALFLRNLIIGGINTPRRLRQNKLAGLYMMRCKNGSSSMSLSVNWTVQARLIVPLSGIKIVTGL